LVSLICLSHLNPVSDFFFFFLNSFVPVVVVLVATVKKNELEMKEFIDDLIVCFPFDPSARIATDDKLARLVVDEDEDRERNGRQPPVELEWVHAQALVHARSVGEEGGQSRFEEDAKVEDVVAHSLVNERVAARLANDQIGPLDDDDRDEEGRVASVLELFASIVSPFLAVRIFQVVDGARVPVLADAEQFAWTESVLSHDDKVDEESGGRLHHTHLAVSHRDQPFIDQIIFERVTGSSFHNVRFGFFVSQRNGRNHVGTQINT